MWNYEEDPDAFEPNTPSMHFAKRTGQDENEFLFFAGDLEDLIDQNWKLEPTGEEYDDDED